MEKIEIPKKYHFGLLGIFDSRAAVRDGEFWIIKKRDPLCDDFHHDWSCYRGQRECPFASYRRVGGMVATGCFNFLADTTGKIPSDWPVVIEGSSVHWRDERNDEAQEFLARIRNILETSIVWM